jgi:hypothetical protein
VTWITHQHHLWLLNSGTINDAAGNAATLTLPTPGGTGSLGANKALVIDTTVGTVTNVTSSSNDGSYKAGDAISVTVTFSETMIVTGTPTLTLATGGGGTAVNYSSGSGSDTFTFTYTVGAGETSTDLDYTATNALALSGGTIKDAAGNVTTLTLATPGAANSLGDNKALVVDTTVPTVTGVTSSTGNGTLKLGDAVSIQVTFSEAVTVNTGGGTPTLTLETGSSDRAVNYASGTGTTELTFTYTVQAGDTSGDLNYKATSSLALNSGTIQDAAGNNATLTLPGLASGSSLGGSKALVIDGLAPTIASVTSTTADGSYKQGDEILITVNFSEVVTLASGNLVVTLETGSTDRTVSITPFTGSTSTTTYTVQAGDTSSDLEVKSIALSAGSVEDALGNAMTSFSIATNLDESSALVIDNTAPTVTEVTSTTNAGSYKTGDAVSIQVVFSEAVTVANTPTITLETGSTDRTVNYASGSGGTTLTFTYTVQAGDTSNDLDYTLTSSLVATGGATIKDAAGNSATLTLPTVGGSDSLAGNEALVIDTTAPTVTEVTSTTAAGSYKADQAISIQVVFSEAVTVANTPTNTLEPGSTDRTVN